MTRRWSVLFERGRPRRRPSTVIRTLISTATTTTKKFTLRSHDLQKKSLTEALAERECVEREWVIERFARMENDGELNHDHVNQGKER